MLKLARLYLLSYSFHDFFPKPLTTPWKLKEDGCFLAASSQNKAFSPHLQVTSRPDGTFVHHFTEKQVRLTEAWKINIFPVCILYVHLYVFYFICFINDKIHLYVFYFKVAFPLLSFSEMVPELLLFSPWQLNKTCDLESFNFPCNDYLEGRLLSWF